MSVCLNFPSAGYIVYIALIYWTLGPILDTEKKYNTDSTIAVRVNLGIILLVVRIGTILSFLFLFFLFKSSLRNDHSSDLIMK